jgi:hypothetical protein
MVDRKIEQAALSFYQLIGAPLYALIDAERYSADATARFIEEIGFNPAPLQPGQTANHEDLGELRTLKFIQERRDSTGAAASYQVEVPLLSILPIPALQIKEAELEFFVKVVDMVAQEQTTRSSQSSASGAEVETPGGTHSILPSSERIDMKTMLGRGQANAPTSPKSAFDMQVRVKIKVGQADIPAGLSRLFNLMEQGVSSTRLQAEEP